jgi:hypothetical protein
MKGWTLVFAAAPLEADIVAAALESAGMRVETIFQSSGFGFAVGGPFGTLVYVPDEQVEGARKIIQKAEAEYRQD